jgi:hypothetical protein
MPPARDAARRLGRRGRSAASRPSAEGNDARVRAEPVVEHGAARHREAHVSVRAA